MEVPHAMAIIMAGVRGAVLQVIATATLAAYTADYGLGRFLYAGLKTRDYAQMIGGSLVVVVLALVVDAALGALQRRIDSRGAPDPDPSSAAAPSAQTGPGAPAH